MKISKFEKELHGNHHEPVVKLSSRSRFWYFVIGGILSIALVLFGIK